MLNAVGGSASGPSELKKRRRVNMWIKHSIKRLEMN